MYRYVLLPLLFFSIAASAQEPAPGGVGRARLWLLSEKKPDGALVWKDRISGQQLDRQSTIAEPAENYSFNFNPSYYFSAGTSGVKLPLPGLDPDQQSLFTVYQPRDTATEKSIWHYQLAGKTQNILTTHRLADLQRLEYLNFRHPAGNLPSISTFFQRQENAEIPQDEVVLVLAAAPADHQLPIAPYTGKLPECILYDRVLSVEERQRVESYLALKYGTTLSATADYLDATGKVIWQADDKFIRRVAGIGRDDLSGLYQKQSGSSYTPGQLVISAGRQAPGNEANTSVLPDQHFLVWADNDAAFDPAEKQVLQPLLLQRQWQLTATGDWSTLPTELQFDSKWLRSPAQPGETYWLVIDRDAKSGFSNTANLDYIPLASRLPDGTLSFQNIFWDTDGSGQDAFTLATGPKLLAQAQLQPPQCRPEQNGSMQLLAAGGRPPFHWQLRRDGALIHEWSTTGRRETFLPDLPSGHYELLLWDADQEEFRESFFFQSTDAPVIPLASQYQLKDQALQLDAAGSGGADWTYRWQGPDGQIVQQSEIAITLAGPYRLQVVYEGCTAEKNILITAPPAGNFRRVELYPNPSSDGHFQLRLHLEQPAAVELSIFDTAGKQIFRQHLEDSDYYHTSQQLKTKGTYLLQLRSGDSQMSLPLIIQ